MNLDLSFGPIELNYSIEHWINDGLMTVFFLLVGLEIERELFVGELSSFKNAFSNCRSHRWNDLDGKQLKLPEKEKKEVIDKIKNWGGLATILADIYDKIKH